MSVSKSLIEELRNSFLNDISVKGNNSVHPKDLERVKTDDNWLQRFLLHQEGNVPNALNMMWTSINWRKDNNVNEITEDNVKKDILCSGAFFPYGADINGCTLLILKSKKYVKGAIDPDELKRCVIYWFERLERVPFINNKTCFITISPLICCNVITFSTDVGKTKFWVICQYDDVRHLEKWWGDFPLNVFFLDKPKGKKITLFFDMEGSGLSNMDMDFIKYLIGLFKEYYPFFLNYIIIFEMPWILSAAFKIIKSWLPEKAIEKIKFVGKKDIKTYVPLDQAFKSWGGQSDYVFSFIPEELVIEENSVTVTPVSPITNNNKKVHFVDGSMSEQSVSSGDKELDGGCLKVTPSSIISFVRDGNELSSTLELQNTDHSSHLSYKLKTTSPEKFRVKPSAGCLGPGDTTSVTVTLLPGFQLGGLSRDKFLVMSTQIDPSEVGNQDLPEFWKNTSGRKVNQHRLKCIQNGEITKNGNVVSVTTTQESEQNNLSKLSTSVAQLNSCQVELHRAIKVTQYYQLATVFLVLLLGIVLGYALRTNLREISTSHYYCRDANQP